MDDGVVHTKKLPHEMEAQHLACHWKEVHHIFTKLATLDLYLKPEKCQFEQAEIEYLGIVIGNGKIQMDPTKTSPLPKWPKPQNVKEVWAILGYTGYYQRFVENYSAIAQLLIELTKKAAKFLWTQCHEDAFNTLIAKMMAKPILLQPNFNKWFVLQTDASALGVGAVLLQQGETSKLQPVDFFSATFTPTKWNYDIYE
jgi:hypothetical protein